MSHPPRSATPRPRWRWKRFFWVVGVCLVVIAASFPWWLPAVLVRVAAHQGVRIGTWQSHGWGHVEYRDITFVRDSVDVRIDSIRVPRFLVVPRGTAEDGRKTPVEIGEVGVRVQPSRADPARPAPSVWQAVHQVREIIALVRRWLPAARARQIAIETGGTAFHLRDVVWERGRLQAAVAVPKHAAEGVASIELTDSGGLVVKARETSRQADLTVSLVDRESGEIHVSGSANWRNTLLLLEADFDREGMVPVTGSLKAEQFSLPASDLGLAGYGPITGRFDAQWSRDSYTVTLTARGEPAEGSEWPVASVDVRGSGTTEQVRLEAVDLTLPGIRAALSAPVAFSLRTGTPSGPAEFSVQAELAAIPVLQVSGRVAGSAQVRPAADGRAEVDFSLHGEGLGWRDLADARVAATGRWTASELAFSRVRVDLGPEAVSEAAFTIEMATRTVRAASIRATVPDVLLRAVSPEWPPCERVELTAEASGPWDALVHRGAARFVGLEWTKNRRIGGSVTWSGQGSSAAAEGELALPGGGTLPFDLQGTRDAAGSVRGTVERVRWVDSAGEWWHLEKPVEAAYDPVARELHLSPWRLVGDEVEVTGEARVRGTAVGDVSLTVAGLDGQRFGGVLPEAIRGGRLERLKLRARWDHGPASVEGDLRAIYAPVTDMPYAIEAEFATREGGLAFGSVEVHGTSGVVLRGVGQLPLLLEGTDQGFRVDFQRDGPIALDLASEPNPVFWKSIADLTGWTVNDPRVACRLRGTWAAPRGELDFAAATLQPPAIKLATGGELPEFTDLAIKLVADDDGISIAQGMVAIDYRWVTLSGQAPWTVWTEWRETGELAWRRSTFELATSPLPIAIASRILPTDLAPEGEVSIRIGHDAGTGLSGRVWLHGAALRPLGPLGSVREITSELDFSGYTVSLTRLDGVLGGQPVRVTGAMNLSDPTQKEFSLHVKSSRVPLVRRAGLIVRTEVDLLLKQERTGPPRVTGRVDFGPSIYRTDLLELIPAGVDRPERRPPYFSVEEKPFADWELAVEAHGEAFLQLTTPFYKDLLSTDVRLSGTLGEPRVEGWVWGTGGVVSFPFGRIPVEQVLVTLSRENPFEPQMVVSGAGRVLGYDIRMEVSGSASEPRLLFTSDPPLTSQQIFMMLTTGAVPDDTHMIGTSDRASRLALFLGRNLAAGLGLGGGYGGDERLEVRSGEDFTRAGRETIVVQYDIDHRWSVVGEYDRFDAYNGGIKFRLINR